MIRDLLIAGLNRRRNLTKKYDIKNKDNFIIVNIKNKDNFINANIKSKASFVESRKTQKGGEQAIVRPCPEIVRNIKE
jgi:hypothetical protein